MTGKRGEDKEAQIKAVADELDGLLDQLTESVSEIDAILKRPKRPPGSEERVVSRD